MSRSPRQPLLPDNCKTKITRMVLLLVDLFKLVFQAVDLQLLKMELLLMDQLTVLKLIQLLSLLLSLINLALKQIKLLQLLKLFKTLKILKQLKILKPIFLLYSMVMSLKDQLILIKETFFIQDQSSLNHKKLFPNLKFKEQLFLNQLSLKEPLVNQSSNNKLFKLQLSEKRKSLDLFILKTKVDQLQLIIKFSLKTSPLVFQDRKHTKRLMFNQFKISKNKF